VGGAFDPAAVASGAVPSYRGVAEASSPVAADPSSSFVVEEDGADAEVAFAADVFGVPPVAVVVAAAADVPYPSDSYRSAHQPAARNCPFLPHSSSSMRRPQYEPQIRVPRERLRRYVSVRERVWRRRRCIPSWRVCG